MKPAPPPEGRGFSWSSRRDKGLYTASNVTLRQLVVEASGLPYWLVITPAWMETERYSINAKLPEGAGKDDFKTMLMNLLVERFQMQTHHEHRELPVYNLVVTKNGPKLKEVTLDPEPTAPEMKDGVGPPRPPLMRSTAPPPDKDGFPVVDKQKGWGSNTNGGMARLTARGQTMTFLADLLTGRTQQKVFDKTGLTGTYDFRLEFVGSGNFAPMQMQNVMMPSRPGMQSPPVVPAPDDPASDAGGPTLFKALQDQLGLKLEAAKAPQDVLVIDKAEKVPIEN